VERNPCPITAEMVHITTVMNAMMEGMARRLCRSYFEIGGWLYISRGHLEAHYMLKSQCTRSDSTHVQTSTERVYRELAQTLGAPILLQDACSRACRESGAVNGSGADQCNHIR